MSAPIELKKSRILDTINESLPSKATYYNSEIIEDKKSTAVRYDGFVLNKGSAAVPFNVDDLKLRNEEVRQDLTRGNPDILPTGATLKMLKQTRNAPEKPFESDADVNFKVNAKGKFIFTIYAIMVLSLILVIVLNAVVINRGQQEQELLEGKIASITASVSVLERQSDLVLETSKTVAQSYGMSFNEPKAIKADVPSYGEVVKYNSSTNWFDTLCDFFN